MDGGSFERLIPLLIFGAVAAVNYLGPWFRRWLKQQQEAAAEAEQSRRIKVPKPAPAQQSRPARQQPKKPQAKPSTAPRPQPADVPDEILRAAQLRASRVAESAPAVRERQPMAIRALLADHHRLRRALVVAAILGPCRAQQPHDPRD